MRQERVGQDELEERKIGQTRKSLKAMHLDIMHFAVLSLLHDSVKKRERGGDYAPYCCLKNEKNECSTDLLTGRYSEFQIV